MRVERVTRSCDVAATLQNTYRRIDTSSSNPMHPGMGSTHQNTYRRIDTLSSNPMQIDAERIAEPP